MGQILLAFIDICRLRSTPQDLPGSNFLLLVALAGMLSVNAAAAVICDKKAMLLEFAVLIIFTAGVLTLAGRQNRFVQTLTALAGTDAIINFLYLPIGYWNLLEQAGVHTGTPQFIGLIMFIWNTIVLSHIFRHALSSWFIVGFFTAICYVWIAVTMYAFFDPSIQASFET